jgi:hypothetical protein
MRSAPLAGRLFSITQREIPEPIKATVENADQAIRDTAGASDQVVLFLPGPVTRADLHRENLRRAATIRRRRRRSTRAKWCEENAGTLMFVTGLLVLAWLVAAR